MKKYAWCVLDNLALEHIRDFAGSRRVIDFGAGTGYNSWLLSQVGLDVIAVDYADGWKTMLNGTSFYDVHLSDDTYSWLGNTQNGNNDVLFLSWPVYARKVMFDSAVWDRADVGGIALEHFLRFGGTHVIHVGEDHYGCTGGALMWDLLEDMALVADHDILQWYGMHDTLQFYVKKNVITRK